jgi:hypothetical protein
LQRSKHWCIAKDCAEATVLKDHFSKVIRHIKAGKWKSYGTRTKTDHFRSLSPWKDSKALMDQHDMPCMEMKNPAVVFDEMTAETRNLILKPRDLPGDKERHLWGLTSLEWKQEEKAMEREEDVGDVDDNRDELEDSDDDHCDFPLFRPQNPDDDYVYYA